MSDDTMQQPRRAGAENASGDALLLLRVARGDEGAMAQIFEQHSGLVYSVGLRVLKDTAQAEDLVQDVFMQMWSKPLAFDPARGGLAPLLAVMARNRAIDMLRSRKVTEPAEDAGLVSPFNLAGDAEHHLLLDRVRTVAAGLPVEQKIALDMAFFEGLTHSEIAQKTGAPLGTVKTRIRAALSLLGRTLRA